jgi:hypothetical protein
MPAAKRQAVLGLIVSKTDVVEFARSVVSVFKKPLSRQRGIEVDVCSATCRFMLYRSRCAETGSHPQQHFVERGQICHQWFYHHCNGSRPTSECGAANGVRDQGPGIDANDLPHVFERFYQSQRLLAQNKEGTGVGLSIVKEYVLLHRGTVQVLSDGKSGTYR